MEARGFASPTHEFITVVLAALIGAGPLYGQSELTSSRLTPGVPAATSAQAPTDTSEMTLTAEQAFDLALKNNHGLKIASEKVQEMDRAKRVAAGDYYPKLLNASGFVHITDTVRVNVAQGSLGTVPGIGIPIPTQNFLLDQGGLNLLLSGTLLVQPLTQLIKIRQANKAAQADVNASRSTRHDIENQIALGVRQLYIGLVTSDLDLQTASLTVDVAQQKFAEAKDAVAKGAALEVTQIGAHASLLDAQQKQLEAKIRHSDFSTDLVTVLGLSPSVRLKAAGLPAELPEIPSKEECIKLAQSASPEIQAAQETVSKAGAGVTAAKANYIPDVSVMAGHVYQNGVPFLAHNTGVFGASLTYDIFDGGKKHALIQQRETQKTQAEENVARLKASTEANVSKALDKVEQTRNQVEVAREAVTVREEGDRLAKAQSRFGAAMPSQVSEAAADLSKAKTDLLKARAGYDIARSELFVLIGRQPR
jgi:outer membrane protein TolC